MVKIRMLLILLFGFNLFCIRQDSTIHNFISSILNENNHQDYVLVIPVVMKDTHVRLVITRSSLKKYFSGLDSARYSNNDTLVSFIEGVLNRKHEFDFSYVFYKYILKLGDCTFIDGKNKYLDDIKRNKINFLSKVLLDYDCHRKYFTLNFDINTDFNYIIEALFNLQFVVSYGDGFIGVTKFSTK